MDAPYVRPLSEVRDILLERARQHRNPMEWVDAQRAQAIFDVLDDLNRDRWADAFGLAAEPFWEAALEAEAVGNQELAQQHYLQAYGLFRVARYPAPNSPAKKAAYRRSQAAFLRAARFFDPPVSRVEMDFSPGPPIVGYLQQPAASSPLPIIVQWGGIDSFKEDRNPAPYLHAGWATMAIDMPGVGDAPLPGSETAERLWDSVFDWIHQQPRLDSARVAVVGSSTGGYWATKIAHTHRHQIRAAVNHGGPCHLAFQPAWIAQSCRGEYPFELAETLASAFGLATYQEWVNYAPRLSLLEQGILDQDCAPLLCVNGIQDSIFPIEDMYLLLQHGLPKSARFFPGGHMGHHRLVFPTIVRWLKEQFETVHPASP